MTEPQVWTLIGVFAASTFGMLGLVSSWFVRVMTANFDRVDAHFDRVDATMNAKFDQLNSKIEHLDRDVRTLFRRVFPEYPDAD